MFCSFLYCDLFNYLQMNNINLFNVDKSNIEMLFCLENFLFFLGGGVLTILPFLKILGCSKRLQVGKN